MIKLLLLATFVCFTCHAKDTAQQEEPHPYTITFFDIPQGLTETATVKEKKDVKEVNKGAVKAESPLGPQVPQNNSILQNVFLQKPDTVVTNQQVKSAAPPALQLSADQKPSVKLEAANQLPAPTNQIAGQQPNKVIQQSTVPALNAKVQAQVPAQQDKAQAAPQQDKALTVPQQDKAPAAPQQAKAQAPAKTPLQQAQAQTLEKQTEPEKAAAQIQPGSSQPVKAQAKPQATSQVGVLGTSATEPQKGQQKPNKAEGANVAKGQNDAQQKSLSPEETERKKAIANLVPVFKSSSKNDHSLSFQKGSIKQPKHTIYPECHQCPENSTYSSCVRSQTLKKCNEGLNNICYTRSVKDSNSNSIKYEMGCADHNLCLGARAFPCRDASHKCFTCCQWDRCNSNPHGGDYELDSINLDELQQQQQQGGATTTTHGNSLTLTIGAIILQAGIVYLFF